MKRLFLLRHAKSDWHADYDDDHGRPLNPRGQEAARRMGHFLAALGQVPELILSSSAVRARNTAELAAMEGKWDCELRLLPELYHCSPRGALGLLAQEGGEAGSVLLVGHEPTWSELASLLLGGGETRADIKMVTATLARFDLPIASWTESIPGRAILAFLVSPKLLAKGMGLT